MLLLMAQNDPWASLKLREVPFRGGTLLLDRALEPQTEAVKKVFEEFVAAARRLRAERERRLLHEDRAVKTVNEILSFTPDALTLNTQKEILEGTVEKFSLTLAPANRLRFLLVRDESVSAFLREGGSLPGCRFDAARERVDYDPALLFGGNA